MSYSLVSVAQMESALYIDIAPLVLFLCGEGARKITGQVISVNGGLNA